VDKQTKFFVIFCISLPKTLARRLPNCFVYVIGHTNFIAVLMGDCYQSVGCRSVLWFRSIFGWTV